MIINRCGFIIGMLGVISFAVGIQLARTSLEIERMNDICEQLIADNFIIRKQLSILMDEPYITNHKHCYSDSNGSDISEAQ